MVFDTIIIKNNSWRREKSSNSIKHGHTIGFLWHHINFKCYQFDRPKKCIDPFGKLIN